MARNRARGVDDFELLQIAKKAKADKVSSAEFKERIRQAGGYASIPSVDQRLHNYRNAVEEAMSTATDATDLETGRKILELLEFDRATKKGNPLAAFRLSDDGVIRRRNDPANGLNLADVVADVAMETPIE